MQADEKPPLPQEEIDTINKSLDLPTVLNNPVKPIEPIIEEPDLFS